MGVPDDPIFLPLAGFRNVLHEPRIEVTDTTSREAERISAEEAVKVIVNELPIEGEVVGNEDRAGLAAFVQPGSEGLHDYSRVFKGFMLVAGEATDSQCLGQEAVR